LALRDVRLSPGQAGLFNGWGVFTTLRIFKGRPFASERHWKRLSNDAKRLQIPFDFDYETLLTQLHDLLRINEVKNGCARVYFVYNKVGYWCSDESFPITDLVMCTTEPIAREGMAKLCLIPYGRLAVGHLAGTKVTSWLGNVWSLEQARHRGFDEAIILNERGEVAE
jgi:branched-subunit amino acid aminotransferase/4-amino-4-deoxychorismate lyase